MVRYHSEAEYHKEELDKRVERRPPTQNPSTLSTLPDAMLRVPYPTNAADSANAPIAGKDSTIGSDVAGTQQICLERLVTRNCRSGLLDIDARVAGCQTTKTKFRWTSITASESFSCAKCALKLSWEEGVS